MKAKQLRERLQTFNDDDDVVVTTRPLSRPVVYGGGEQLQCEIIDIMEPLYMTHDDRPNSPFYGMGPFD